MKAIITIGISASGKSTWADEFISDREREGEFWKKIERDCIRRSILIQKGISHELDWSKWNWKWENQVTGIHRSMIEQAANVRQSIVISDTNLNPKHLQSLIFFLRDFGYEISFREFHVTWDEAVRRDTARKNGVGISVITKQWEQFNQYTRRRKVSNTREKEKAIIVDVDGTLAHKCNRDIYDASKAINDYLDKEVVRIVDVFGLTHKILITSGRSEKFRTVTEQWLLKNKVHYDRLLMRSEGDVRPDEVVKEEIFWKDIDPKYQVDLVLDDRPKVCRMWRDIGLKVLQCGNPYIEF